jgi:hypothetical protein
LERKVTIHENRSLSTPTTQSSAFVVVVDEDENEAERKLFKNIFHLKIPLTFPEPSPSNCQHGMFIWDICHNEQDFKDKNNTKASHLKENR